MNLLLKVIVALPALLFIVLGVRWLVDPAAIAPEFGMTALTGAGLSTQVGDLSAFFLTLGLCILTGLVTGNRTWFYPPVMLLLLATLGRLIAWLVHDAALALPMILVEVIVSALLLLASARLAEDGRVNADD